MRKSIKRVIAGVIIPVLTAIMMVVSVIAVVVVVIIWSSLVWPWYLWRGIRTLIHPRSFA